MSPFAVLSAIGAMQQLRATVNGWSRRVTNAAAFGAVALALVILAVGFLALVLFFALAEAMAPVAAAAIVAAVLLVLATVAALLARHAIHRGRGGTGTQLPVPLVGASRDGASGVMGSLGAIDPHTLYALAAGVVGGLIAAQLRVRGTRAESGSKDD